MRFHNGVVPLITALFVCGDGLETAGQTFDVVIGRTRRALAERCITELTGQVRGAADDDGIVFLLGGPVDQSAGRIPEGFKSWCTAWDEITCSSTTYDLSTDKLNCGQCGHVCADDKVCINGYCKKKI
jgi:hypothetical protein